MQKKKDLLRSLTEYFVMSTFIPFLIIILISVSGTSGYYRREVLDITDSYVASLSREAALYTNQLKQILITPNWSTAASNKIRDINKKNSLTIMDKEEFEQIMGSLISSIRYTGNDFFSAIITNGKDVIYSSSNYIDTSLRNDCSWEDEEWFKLAVMSPQNINFIPRHIPDYYDIDTSQEVLSLVTTVRNIITQEPYAVIKIDFLPSKLSKHIDLDDFGVGACAFIEDDNGNLIEETHSNPRMKDLQEQYMNGDDVENKVLTIEKEIEGTPYKLTVLIDIWAVRRKSLYMLLLGMVLYAFALITALLLNRRFARRVSLPIEQMKEVFSKVQSGDFSARYVHQDNCELEDLGNSLNIMTNKLEDNIKKTYLAEIAEKDAVNKALLSQIQPHFLFNTLNTMVGLLYEERYDEVENDIYALSDIMRSVLRDDPTWTLKEEIEFLDDYMSLQISRFGERLNWKSCVCNGIETIIIPRLLLQPFVENAVIHGMEPSASNCTVSLNVECNDGKVVIDISDDGVGFDMSEMDISKSIGLKNCRDRLMLFRSDAEMTIDSSVGRGCDVHIVFMKEN